MTGVFAYLVGGVVFSAVILACATKEEVSRVTWGEATLLLLLWPLVAVAAVGAVINGELD